MKKIFELFTAFLLPFALLTGCYDDGTDFYSSETRVSFYPALENFAADGSTAGGNEYISSIVTVNKGAAVYDGKWTASIVDAPSWATVEQTCIYTTYYDAYGSGESYLIGEDGVNIYVEANTSGTTRSFVLRITLADGDYKDFTIKQSGK